MFDFLSEHRFNSIYRWSTGISSDQSQTFQISWKVISIHYFVFKAKTSKFFKVSDSGTKILAFTKSYSKWECIFTMSLLVSTCWKKV